MATAPLPSRSSSDSSDVATTGCVLLSDVEPARYLECLDADARRLREVAARDLEAHVPSCPGWTVADLVEHTGMVYVHKAEAMRGDGEGDWPPPGTEGREPLELFDDAYAQLTAEFEKRRPEDASGTWYGPDQSVGFWIRRMAQETVIHRLDAELALSERFAPIPDDLAKDGIDEVLVRFLSYATITWPQAFGPQLDDCDSRAVAVRADGAQWVVRLAPDGVVVSTDTTGDVDATVSGSPDEVLAWVWRRTDDETVAIDGDASLVAKLRELLGTATNL